MPVTGHWKCTLVGSGAGKAILQGTRETFLACKEHHVLVKEEKQVATTYVEVSSGTLEVHLQQPHTLEDGYVLIRIEIDDTPRVQRLVPLSYRNAASLLRFSATEYCEDAFWYSHSWNIKSIPAQKMLRQTTAQLGYGTITVSILPVTDVVKLGDGGLNHEISTFVTKKFVWATPAISTDEYQDKRLTMCVGHDKEGPVEITRCSHKHVNFAIEHALRLDWKAEDSPCAKFIFNYRSKGKIPSPSRRPSSNPCGSDRLLTRKSVSSSAADGNRRVKRERSTSPCRTYHSSRFSPVVKSNFGEQWDLTTEEGRNNFKQHCAQLVDMHTPKRVKISPHLSKLKASIAALETQINQKRADRIAELTAMSEESQGLEEKLQALTTKIEELWAIDDSCIEVEEEELEGLRQQLHESEEMLSPRNVATASPIASDTQEKHTEAKTFEKSAPSTAISSLRSAAKALHSTTPISSTAKRSTGAPNSVKASKTTSSVLSGSSTKRTPQGGIWSKVPRVSTTLRQSFNDHRHAMARRCSSISSGFLSTNEDSAHSEDEDDDADDDHQERNKDSGKPDMGEDDTDDDGEL